MQKHPCSTAPHSNKKGNIMKQNNPRRALWALALLAAVACAASCTKVIDFTGDETSRYAVMYSAIEPDSTVKVRLTYSRFFLSSGKIQTIENAGVQLYCNGRAVAQTTADSGNYYFDCRPQPGDTLSVVAEVPDYPRGVLRAGTRVPAQAHLEYLGYTKTEDTYGETGYDIRLRLADPVGENYYMLKLRKLCFTISYNDTTCIYYSGGFSCNESLFTDVTSVMDGMESSSDLSSLTFSDVNFDGKTVDFVIHTTAGYAARDTTLPQFLLQFSSMNRDWYRYATTQADAEGSDDGFSNLFSEAVQVYTNVENGIGVFGAKTTGVIPAPVPLDGSGYGIKKSSAKTAKTARPAKRMPAAR